MKTITNTTTVDFDYLMYLIISYATMVIATVNISMVTPILLIIPFYIYGAICKDKTYNNTTLLGLLIGGLIAATYLTQIQ